MSEFGSGIVVCLAKFSEHLMAHGPYNECDIRKFAEWTPGERERLIEASQRYPHGDSANLLNRMAIYEIMLKHSTKKKVVSDSITMWMNAASDHFYDLDESAPPVLRQLADLCLEIGHGHTNKIWTIKTIDRIRDLWRESCIHIDAMLGVEAEWGDF